MVHDDRYGRSITGCGHANNQGPRGRDPDDQSRTLHQVYFSAIWHGEMQSVAHDGSKCVAFSRSARRHPSRSHGNGALSIQHWVSDGSEPMNVLRNHICHHPIGPSYEQAIQAPHGSSQASSQIPDGNMSLVLTCKTGCFKLTGVCDASWGNNPDDEISTSGYLFMMAGGPLSFKTALQSMTTQSTMEAELTSMTLASNEVFFSRI